MHDPRAALPAALSAALLLSTSATAQGELTWALPNRTAALYEREHAILVEQPRDGGPSRWRPRFVREMNPPHLIGDELDATRSSVAADIPGLRDLPRHIAFDLRHGRRGGRTRYLIRQNNEHKATRVDVRFAPMDRSGRQRITATLRYDAKQRVPRYEISGQAKISGKLELTRVFDAGARRVHWFESTSRLTWHDYNRGSRVRRARVAIRETWKWKEDLAADSAAFRKRAGATLAKAIAYLEGWLARLETRSGKGDVFAVSGPPERGWHWPPTANLPILLWSLVYCGADPTRPVIREGYRQLRRREPRGIYTRAASIMALERLYAPAREREQLREKLIAAPSRRAPSAADRALLVRWTRALTEEMRRNARKGGAVRWRDSGMYDNHRAAWAVQGLRSARLCGVPIPARVWRETAEHWLATAHRDGGEYGWGLRPDYLPLSKYTMAGAMALAYCKEALGEQASARGRIDEAVQGAHAWLGARFSTRIEPCDTPFYWKICRQDYLFFLDRACLASGRTRFGERDVYFESALILIGWQDRSGSLGNLAEAARAATLLRPYVTGPITPR